MEAGFLGVGFEQAAESQFCTESHAVRGYRIRFGNICRHIVVGGIHVGLVWSMGQRHGGDGPVFVWDGINPECGHGGLFSLVASSAEIGSGSL